MNKKILRLIPACLLLACAFIWLTACGAESAREESSRPDDTPPAEIPSAVYNTVAEYGEPDLITIGNDSPLLAYIRFPAAGDPTDAIIAEWARDTYQSAYDKILELRNTSDPTAEGEINIQFDSYLADNRYAGVVEYGIFNTSDMAHPADIARTFNIDTETGTLLANSEILDYSQTESILALTRTKLTEKYPGAADIPGKPEIDENWLEHIALGHDGVIIVLERYAFLPGYFGMVKVTLPYDELGTAFILKAQPAPPAPPAESSAEPSAAPDVPPQSGGIDPSKPMIALTFDDGPSKYTSQVLDILEKYGCRATFCTVGNLVDARKDTVRRASGLGCEVIGHSWDHRDLSKLSAEEIKKEIEDTSAVIEAAAGVSLKMYRPPYGAVNDTVKSVSAELGYSMICWSVDPEDWKTRDADAVYSAVMSGARDRAIVLSHDLYGTTADAYERIIPELLSQGYQLVTVSELMYYSGITPEAGEAYYNGK